MAQTSAAPTEQAPSQDFWRQFVTNGEIQPRSNYSDAGAQTFVRKSEMTLEPNPTDKATASQGVAPKDIFQKRMKLTAVAAKFTADEPAS